MTVNYSITFNRSRPGCQCPSGSENRTARPGIADKMNRPIQLDLFNRPTLNVARSLKIAMNDDVRESGLSREQLVDRMNELAGKYGVCLANGNCKRLTMEILEKWLNPNGHDPADPVEGAAGFLRGRGTVLGHRHSCPPGRPACDRRARTETAGLGRGENGGQNNRAAKYGSWKRNSIDERKTQGDFHLICRRPRTTTNLVDRKLISRRIRSIAIAEAWRKNGGLGA